ncbi:citrate:H+ symporter [Romboutsia ilealis]|uniref:Citrate:H+ symporter n=2 Tax=Romboutsia faecis TaxID=2764597 RepID=A0ABR7JJV3_9FIRM|nr:citrate:H+ symporter [Romboutsia faecis]MRN25908.1 citrate:H+ symporter [Romboutsia ilealis]
MVYNHLLNINLKIQVYILEDFKMLSLIGFAMIAIMMYVLLKGKASPLVLFIVLPIIGALLGGFSPAEIGEFAMAGLDKTSTNAILFIFSITYFGVMNDVGMFDVVIDNLVKKAGNSVVAITVVTAIVGILGHLDGTAATTVLVTVPAMLPLYKKLNIRPQVLLLIVASAMGVMNLLPWGGPTVRTAVVLGMDANVLWKTLIPIQLMGVVTTIGLAAILGIIESKRGAGVSKNSSISIEDEIAVTTVDEKVLALKRPKLAWFNILLTAVVIVILVLDAIPATATFMLGLAIALIVNFPKVKEQEGRIKAHASSALLVSATMLASGVFVGVLDQSGMLTAMSETVLGLVPSSMGPLLHLIMGVLALPLGMILGTDAYFYGLLPLVIEVAATYGIPALQVALTMIIGKNVALLISPLVPPTFLAIGLADVDIKDHIKFSFGWLYAISLLMLVGGILFGIIAL